LAEPSRASSGTVVVTKTAGRSWLFAKLPIGTSQVTAISCRSVSFCSALAITGSGWAALFSSDGGADWR
jgi:hypothetical protein